MTTAHVEKFAELLGKDPALLAKLGLEKVNADAGAAAASAAAFIASAVKEGTALGLEVTGDEAMAYLTAEAKAGESGELSDSQLEAVAGGKISGNQIRVIIQYGGMAYTLGKQIAPLAAQGVGLAVNFNNAMNALPKT